MENFDVLLRDIKPFGKFQRLLVFTFGVYSCAISPSTFFGFIFLGFAPTFWHNTAANGSLSALNGSACDHRHYSNIGNSANGSADYCDYTFDTSKWTETLVTKFCLVCERDKTWTNILTVMMVGSAVGSTVFSLFQDHFGRKPAVVFSYLWIALIGILLIFAKSVSVVMALAFLFGIQNRLAFALPWLYCQEFTDIAHQGLVMLIICVAFAFGAGGFALLVWQARRWTTIVIVIIVLHAVMIVPSLFLPESPRWLLSVGKVDDALKIIRKMTKWNKSSFKADIITPEIYRRQNKYAYWSLYTNGLSLIIKTSVMCFAQLTSIVVYSGLTYNVRNFGVNPYLIFFVQSMVEVPAALLVPVSNRLGRIPVSSLGFLVCGIFSLLTLPATSTWLIVVFVFIMKLSLTLAFDVCFMLNAELFPTILRATANGYTYLYATLAAIAVPEIVHLSKSNPHLPLIIFSIFAFVASALMLLLPEPAGKPLIDSLEEEKKRPISLDTIRSNLCLEFARRRSVVEDPVPKEDHELKRI